MWPCGARQVQRGCWVATILLHSMMRSHGAAEPACAHGQRELRDSPKTHREAHHESRYRNHQSDQYSVELMGALDFPDRPGCCGHRQENLEDPPERTTQVPGKLPNPSLVWRPPN